MPRPRVNSVADIDNLCKRQIDMTTLSRLRSTSPTVHRTQQDAAPTSGPGIDLGDPANRYISDIPWSVARSAFRGTTHWPDQHARQAIADYANTLAADFAELSKLADTDDLRAELDRWFSQYRVGYQIRMVAFLTTRSSMVSVAIYAPRDPAISQLQAVKLAPAAQVRAIEVANYRDRMIEMIRADLRPSNKGGIVTTAGQARARAAKLEIEHDKMKAVNLAIRTNADDRAAAVASIVKLGYDEGTAERFATPDYAGRTGFSQVRIKNSYAEIVRLRSRAAKLDTSTASQSPADELAP